MGPKRTGHIDILQSQGLNTMSWLMDKTGVIYNLKKKQFLDLIGTKKTVSLAMISKTLKKVLVSTTFAQGLFTISRRNNSLI